MFREVKRVLKRDGTLWVNIGDSYASLAGGYDSAGSRGNLATISKNTMAAVVSGKKRKPPLGLKPKDLVGIPWMLAFALRADGWYLRQEIIWHKPNPMPESVTDRCTKAHEQIFLLSKSPKYYFDAVAIKTDLKEEAFHMIPKGWAVGPGSHNSVDHATEEGRERKAENIKAYKHRGKGDMKLTGHSGNYDAAGNLIGGGKANKRSVWSVTTMPYKGAHFATFPELLIEDCIKAGCKVGGLVLDPFSGAGTTALVAAKLNRDYVGIELNKKYVAMSEKRLHKELGIFYKQSA